MTDSHHLRRLLGLSLAAALAAAASCLPDFGDFEVGDGGGGTDGDADVDGDTDVDGDADADGDTDADGDPGVCPTSVPHVLVGIRWPYGTPSVARIALGAEGSGGNCSPGGGGFCRCGDLSGRGSFEHNIFSVGWVPPGYVGVGLNDGAALLDEQTDEVLWNIQNGQRYTDVFPLTSPGGGTLAAFARWHTGSSDVRGVNAFALTAGTTEPTIESPASGFPMNVPGAAQSPLDPRRVIVLRPDMWAARELDPADPADARDLLEADPDKHLRSIAAAASEEWNAVAWAGVRAGTDQGAVYYNSDADSEPWTMMGPVGPSGCPELDCDFVDVVPDPSAVYYFVAICDDRNSDRRMVIRFPTFGTPCDVLLDGGTLHEEQEITSVSVAPSR